MTIRIVTDSGSDLPQEIAKELDISIVPLRVHFGSASYRDGVDLQPDEFFRKLVSEQVHPTTSSPSPGDFVEVYDKLGDACDGIISVHLSSKLSATYDAALKGKELVAVKKCPIEVVDSRLVTIPLAMVAIAAAKAAAVGKSMQDTLDHIGRLVPAMRSYGVLDTLKYIVKGGRLGRAGAAVGSLLPVRPLLTIKEGAVTLVGMARTRSQGIERLLELLKSVRNVQEIGIAHSSAGDEMATFMERLRGFAPDIKPVIANLGPAIGTHGGPGTILVAMQQELGRTDADLAAEGKKPLVSMPSMQSLKDTILQRKPKDTAPFIEGRLVPAAIPLIQ
jgi:DegV family protein with EDD domain